jgi:hypothetical protein
LIKVLISVFFVRLSNQLHLDERKSTNSFVNARTVPQFNYVLYQPDSPTSITTTVNPNSETCSPTGTTSLVRNLILAAVKNLKTNLTIVSNVALDDYHTPLNFVQNNVPTVLDDTVM